ncbi:MAG: general secretion pathway protein GspK [Geminicoccaceae bacterium]|nr:general secretion pathway protein GspK [Geminicoccaceae bacterium]
MSAGGDRVRKATSGDGERGAALVFVLWLITAITVLTASLSTSRNEIVLDTRVELSRLRAGIALDSALEVAVEKLRTNGFEPVGELKLTFGDVAVDVRVSPESGRIDLNAAPEELIGGLAAASVEDREEAARIADAILDWRDENDLRRAQGAERDQYHRADLGYGPGDGPFRYVDELRLVLGMPAEVAARIAEISGVHGGNAEIGLASIAAPVMRAKDLALGLDVPTGPIEEEANETPPFTTDAAGLYRVDIEAVVDGGYTRRTRAVVWTSPATPGRDYEILDYQGWHLPR